MARSHSLLHANFGVIYTTAACQKDEAINQHLPVSEKCRTCRPSKFKLIHYCARQPVQEREFEAICHMGLFGMRPQTHLRLASHVSQPDALTCERHIFRGEGGFSAPEGGTDRLSRNVSLKTTIARCVMTQKGAVLFYFAV
jgi:hypothetical protein